MHVLYINMLHKMAPFSSRSMSNQWLLASKFSSILFIMHWSQQAIPSRCRHYSIVAASLYPITAVAFIVCFHSLYCVPHFLLSFMSVYVALQYFPHQCHEALWCYGNVTTASCTFELVHTGINVGGVQCLDVDSDSAEQSEDCFL